MQGIEAVHARIAEIQTLVHGQLARVQGPPPQTQAPSGVAFAAALEKVKGGAPPELAGFGNGRIPPGALAPLGIGDHRMYAPAARSFRSLLQAAATDGVEIGVTDSYRSYEEQVDLARRKGLYSQGGLAATPGTSDHGWGLSLDLDLDPTAQQWMRDHGARFGFVEDVPREPWHWTYQFGT